MVEMIFVLPVLLVIVFAIAEMGLMFSRWLTLSNAVREGARTAVVFRQNCNPANVQTEVENRVVSYANAGGVGISAGDVNTAGLCAGSGTDAVVDATFNFRFQVLPADMFAPGVNPTIPLTYSSTMRNE